MKIQTKITGAVRPCALKLAGAALFSCSLLVFDHPVANATSISGDSLTILRMRENTRDDQLFPLYEYLNLSASDTGSQGTISVQIGGWGRIDLGDRSSQRRSDGDIQYGFLSYRANRNNLQFNAGRQWVVEGVATERLDGLYLRTDLAAGFTAATFVGTPVTTNPNFEGGELMYGGRIAHTLPKYYSIGISALRNETDAEGLREEEGVDVWLHPIPLLDISGRSSYNSLSNGWAEHAYTLSVTPMDALRLSASMQRISYRDYFYHVTTSALSLTNGILDPNEELWNVGGSVSFMPTKNINVALEYNRYEYEIAGNADYYGVTASFTTPTALTAGASFHRMDGDTGPLRYNQYRAWATQKFGPADLTLDFFDVDFDSSITGRTNTYSLAAAAGYNFNRSLRVAADVDYQRSTDFDNELRGLVKLSYAFGFGKEGQ